MRRALFVVAALAWSLPAQAQRLDPIQWSLTLETPSAPPGATVLARLEARMQPGWHLYSLSTPKGGPIPTTIRLAENQSVLGYKVHQPKPVRAFDRNFNLDTETYETSAVFLLEVTLKPDAGPARTELTALVRYQACDDRLCIPPVRKSATAVLSVDPAARPAAVSIPSGYSEFGASAAAAPSGGPAPDTPPSTRPAEEESLGWFPLVAFGLGLAAVFTPCVFPMIPITVSFFLQKGNLSRGQGLFQALLFSLGIVVLFSGLGLITTAILGPFGVVQLGSNVWVNLFIAAIFLIFGLSLLGAFEITIPSGILTRLDRVSGKGGVAGTLLMGLTFSLTSFACVGPFVGTLLAASLQSGGLRPVAGMVSFASGLALPFFFLALFPSYLKRMPKSGGWLARVKVVMGFVILAAMLKYASNVDQVMQWSLLTRERFLAAWIVLFSLAGLYLLGFLRLEGAGRDEPLGLPRLLVAAVFLAFSISLVPGMFGGRLGELDAYVPASTVAPSSGGERGLAWMKNQYRDALERARAENKLVFLNFTGYACTNCHWMKANLFTRPEIASALEQFVLVELYTDGADEASRLNQQLQESRFSTVAIPYYAILNPDEKVLASFAGLTRDPQEFLQFLGKGRN
ncbi:MAG: thioredoxin family protein [Bryobacterales bacterium]|nr:thioredoxin family protein [Bryobacterales bacterium]